MVNIAITGGTGFAGSCFIEELIVKTDWHIYSLQRSKEPISTSSRFTHLTWDLRAPFPYEDLKFDRFVHMGAEVHALRSLTNPDDFLWTNVMGTHNALEAARKCRAGLFIYVSTAEVLGGKDIGYSPENAPLRPSNPYAASKAAGELLTQTYVRCYDLPAIVVRTMNLYDMETQADETKFVPMVKKAILAGETVKIHARDGKPGKRQWMKGSTFADELLCLIADMEQDLPLGQIYHLVGEELSNLQMARRVAECLGLPLKYEFVPMPRTHEFRYAIRSTR